MSYFTSHQLLCAYVFSLLIMSYQFLVYQIQAKTLGYQEENDLELFTAHNRSHKGLCDKLDYTFTQRGKEAFRTLLRTPLTDRKLLQERQTIVKRLVNEQELLDALSKELVRFKDNEPMLDTFWQEESEMNKAALRDFYFYWHSLKNLNTSPLWLDIKQIIHGISMFAPVVEHAVLHYLVSKELKNYLGVPCCSEDHDTHDHNKHKHKHKHDEKHMYEISGTPSKVLFKAYTIAHWSIHLLGFKALIDHIYQKIDITKQLQKQLIGLSNCVKSVTTIYSLIVADDGLAPLMPSVKNFEGLVRRKDKTVNSKFDDLIKLLSANTFSGNSSLFSHVGNILAAYALMKEVKDELMGILTMLGELDSYVSIAHLYNSFKDKDVLFSFAHYQENVQAPLLELEGFWNPLIEADKICPQDITLGSRSNACNTIITGPNAGGKSTILKTVTFCVVCGQTLGIVPAKRMRFTPFEEIITSFFITDDMATGNSLFTKEIAHAEEIVSAITCLPENQFSFIAIDELFRSTSFEKGQDVAYDFVQQLGTFKNTISIIATHFPKLTLLESRMPESFHNYKVEVEKISQDELSFTFKRGISDQNRTFDVLRQKGIKINS
jgi:DNA mismatch repair protein MutS